MLYRAQAKYLFLSPNDREDLSGPHSNLVWVWAFPLPHPVWGPNTQSKYLELLKKWHQQGVTFLLISPIYFDNILEMPVDPLEWYRLTLQGASILSLDRGWLQLLPKWCYMVIGLPQWGSWRKSPWHPLHRHMWFSRVIWPIFLLVRLITP